ncbi:MAG: alcohol dehydrogenase [Klenkia sp.]|nr:alcohol dehydrogenase [Klenkia sp.]
MQRCSPAATRTSGSGPSPDPTITSPNDVIVEVGGAGFCRTDIHLWDGQFDAAQKAAGIDLPFVCGHETAGWVAEVGAGVTHVSCRSGTPCCCTRWPPAATARPAAPATTCTAPPACSPASTHPAYGGRLDVEILSEALFPETSFVGNICGTYNELVELVALTARGAVTLTTTTFGLDQVNEALHALEEGRMIGRGVLVPHQPGPTGPTPTARRHPCSP